MSYTQTHLDALREAYASGVTEVTYDGKTVKYRSLADLARAIRAVDTALTATSRTTHLYPEWRRDG